MSGWQRWRGRVVFDLTATKAKYWHRHCPCGVPGDLDHVWRDHLEPTGRFDLFQAPSGAVLRVSWPGARLGGPTDPLYHAIAKPPARS